MNKRKIFASPSPEVSQMEQDHARLIRELSGECMVLLENDGVLPLSPCPVALYGNGARQTVKGGTGSGNVNTRSSISVEQGLREAGYQITTGDWLERNARQYDGAKAAYLEWVPHRTKELGCSEVNVVFSEPFQIPAPVEITADDISASGTDTAIYVISRNSGEGADRRCIRGDYLLFDEEKRQLTQLGTAYTKLIVVLNVGAVMDLSEIRAIPGVRAVLMMGQLGSTGGLALADVLSGKTNPSGRLTDSWARRYEDYPSSAGFSRNDNNVDDEYYTEGIYVGYRYFDRFHVEPLYPFGYGLSYTTFSISEITAGVSGSTIAVRARVTNTGARPGRQVVQVYCSAPEGALPKASQSLVGFAKTGDLLPGQSETVELTWEAADMASYSAELASWILEPGTYVIRIGFSSRDSFPAALVTLDRAVRTAAVKNLFQDSQPVSEIAPPKDDRVVPAGLPVISLDAGQIPMVEAAYQAQRPVLPCGSSRQLTAQDIRDGVCTVEDLVAQLTVEELATLCVGTLRTGTNSVLGSASRLVPGAAGDTSDILLESRGLKSIIMADGPAGLRLQPIFKTDKEGALLPGGNIIDDLWAPFDPKYDETNSDTWYQYCTSIPIGWSLAQSWDPALLERIGSMIGEEMARFGVDLWLAPALNIHRDPLCGRNFEYFSEDPLISGMMAAAITRGVQAHPGKGVTIKHFAANNQEDNRYFSNSHVSERALREIYLRGFQIAIREATPMSIMTSYNLLNGIHTANSFDLIQSVCRDEWGYQGLVMTDWNTSQNIPAFHGIPSGRYPISASTGCVRASNDLQMPGCQKNVDDLIQAVTSGQPVDGFSVTLGDLQFCAANVIRAVLATDV